MRFVRLTFWEVALHQRDRRRASNCSDEWLVLETSAFKLFTVDNIILDRPFKIYRQANKYWKAQLPEYKYTTSVSVSFWREWKRVCRWWVIKAKTDMSHVNFTERQRDSWPHERFKLIPFKYIWCKNFSKICVWNRISLLLFYHL